MKKYPCFGVCLSISLLLAGLLAAGPVTAQESLLTNPNFEEGFHIQGGTAEVSVADGWTAWWVQGTQGQTNQGYLVRPEYQGEDTSVHDGRRVHTGQYAQKIFNTFSTHDAGLLQTVAVPTGANLQFAAWVQTWSTGLDDPHQAVEPGNYRVSIGIDPAGGTNPTSPSVLWSQPVTASNSWIQLSVVGQAVGGQVTVFTRGAPQYRVMHNNSYWDDLSLMEVGDAPLPTAAPQPAQPGEGGGTIYHTVQPNENLFRISLRYNTTVQTLMALNGMYNPDMIYLGQQLLIQGESGASTSAPAQPIRTRPYTVQAGARLGYIASYYGATVEALSALNNIVNPELIFIGQTLVVPGAAPIPVPVQPIIHTVQPGEMLSSIAARYGVNMWLIADANGLSNINFIWMGQRLVIPRY